MSFWMPPPTHDFSSVALGVPLLSKCSFIAIPTAPCSMACLSGSHFESTTVLMEPVFLVKTFSLGISKSEVILC